MYGDASQRKSSGERPSMSIIWTQDVFFSRVREVHRYVRMYGYIRGLDRHVSEVRLCYV